MILMACGVVLSGIMVMLSPLFRISDIQITGNDRISSEYILEASDLVKPVNIFIFSPKKAKQEVSSNLFLEDIFYAKSYPNKLQVTVLERKLIGYVPYVDSYLCLDGEGRVLSVSAGLDEPLPLISGLQVSSFNLGEPLKAENTDAFDVMMALANLLSKYSLLDTQFVSKVDVSDTKDIHLYIYNIDVAFGLISDADEKIRTIKAIIQDNLPDARNVKGTLDVRVIGNQYIFKVLT
jgi:cell division protein FtsQ